MSKRVSVIFPYMTDDEAVLQRLHMSLCAIANPELGLHTSHLRPVLVVNKDTVRSGHYDSFRTKVKRWGGLDLASQVDVQEVWSVDTCQMWLTGFGRMLDQSAKEGPRHDRATIVQIPGDLKSVAEPAEFLQKMKILGTLVQSGDADLAIGDFKLSPVAAKHLIDVYGTYPLLFNWFPEVAQRLWGNIHLGRPRSEFFAVSVRFLNTMLDRRKFAYEQTLAFLVYAESDKANKWKISSFDLGRLSDYGERRRFREAIDQIERTERVLKVLWRELNGGDAFDVEKFEILDRRSTAIREAAMVYMENVLKPPGSVQVAGAKRRV